jgi:hypothetical protein
MLVQLDRTTSLPLSTYSPYHKKCIYWTEPTSVSDNLNLWEKKLYWLWFRCTNCQSATVSLRCHLNQIVPRIKKQEGLLEVIMKILNLYANFEHMTGLHGKINLGATLTAQVWMSATPHTRDVSRKQQVCSENVLNYQDRNPCLILSDVYESVMYIHIKVRVY